MSCVDIDLSNISKDVQIKESLVVPIGEDSLSVNDVLSKLNLQNQIVLDGDAINFVTEIDKEYQFLDVNLMEHSTATVLPFNLVAIPKILANKEISVPGAATNVSFGLDPNSTTQRVDKIEISSLSFGVTMENTNLFVFGTTNPILSSDLKLVLIFPKMYKSGTNTPIDPVQIPVVPFGQSSEVNLSNFYMDTQGSTGTPIEVKLYSGNRDITIGSSSTLKLTVVFNRLDNIVAYGKFKLNSAAPTTLKLPLDMLSSLPAGLRFANPKAKITLQSNVGSYLMFNIESIKAFSKDHSVVRQGTFLNGSTSVVESIDKPLTPGLFITKSLRTLDKDYGSTDLLFDTSVKLDTLEYKFSMNTDDVRNAANPPAFVTPGMSIKANIKIEIPLYFKSGSNISLSDTIQNIDLPFEDIEQATLVLKVTNALPVKATFSMKFLDANNNIITTSLNDLPYVINSGEVDGSGIVTNATISPINIELTKIQANEIKDATGMIYTLVLAGQTNSNPINITKNNYIKVKLGAFVTGKMTTTIGSNNQ